MHIDDGQLGRLFGFAVGGSNLDVLRQLKAIQHAKEFAEEHRCVFVLPPKIPPKGIFVRVPVERDHGFRWKMITQSGGT